MAVTRVLVVEDVEEIADVVAAVLTAAAYEVEVVSDGVAGCARAIEWVPDVVILDLSLPGMDGTEVCRRIRAAGVDSYILMLTARHEEVDKIVGLSVGADDYITKPFSPRELAARVQAMMRRPRISASKVEPHDVVRIGAMAIDPGAREVSVHGEQVALTKTEYDILALLAEHPKRVVTRDRLRSQVWGEDWLADDHAVDVHVSNLRSKLAKAGADGLVRTVRGVGYRIAPDAT
ncbi:MAG TPA: response regulator transcription factor [Mycobacteriales bacterium]|nr:response regulator transcription factor [Mycobacteriales bacterium]